MENNSDNRFPVIMGATASGKSSLALYIAEALDGEIISADSMQLYSNLNIGVAKPTAEEQQRVRHHLIDIVDISEKIDVYRYVKLAQIAIDDIRSRGKLPVIVGGTGMYLKALLYGLDPLPGDATLRTELDAKFDNPAGFEKLKVIMGKCDPEDFARWHKHCRKLIRAYEVFTLTGSSITALQTNKVPELQYPAICWNLVWDRDELKKRIRQRTGEMLAAGWIGEVEDFRQRGIFDSPTAHQVLGYRIISDYLDGKIAQAEIQDKIATATWQLARRQLNWFKGQHPDAETINMPQDYNNLLEKINFHI
ncbi:MAG: tRNA (adenosine(37)-N6)-dimethylallyltransferase MiaA [Victivallaceae bacterium]|nr:tRNA (adenosine(37)-N6)-dimethylallyltransferase MiaA [Victivallaceae bacterium]